MKTETKLLAEFLGTKQPAENHYHFENKIQGHHVWRLDQMKFDTSWDWLMPVLVKIEECLDDLKEDRGIIPVFEDQYSHPWEMPITTGIITAYETAVSLIKWHNTQTVDSKTMKP